MYVEPRAFQITPPTNQPYVLLVKFPLLRRLQLIFSQRCTGDLSAV